MNLAVNCGPFSASTDTGVPYVNTQCVVNALATSYAFVLAKGTVRTSLEKRSTITNSHLLPHGVLTNYPMRYMVMSSRGARAGNFFIDVSMFLFWALSLAHSRQLRAMP